MTGSPTYRPIAITEADRARVLELDLWAFPSAKEVGDFDDLPLAFDWNRTRAVVPADAPDGPEAELVAFHASYEFSRFPVPGATAPVSGLTWVGVHPGHRRRGILTSMIAEHFARSLERGEPVSALFAAEMPIYGRFGYGNAATETRLSIPRGAALRPAAGSDDHTVRIEKASDDKHGRLVAELHTAAGADVGGTGINRPGWATRETQALQNAFWKDSPQFRDGKESRRIAIASRDGQPRGYALFRRKESWEAEGPRGTVHVGEVCALDAGAARALWAVLLDLDLMATVEVGFLAPDDAITQLLVDPRAALPRRVDNVWIRILDVAQALATRQYATDLDLVIDLTDARLPANAGRWHLRADAFGPASAERTSAPADLAMDVRELGAAYLGGFSLAALATAGLVTESTPGALQGAAAGFAWPVAPVCSWVF